MKLTIKILLIAVISYFAQQYFPWWSAVATAFLINLLISSPSGKSFLSGFLGIGLLWMVMAVWIDISTDSILTERIAQIVMINDKYLLILATSLIGAIAGGMGGLSGGTFRKMFEKKKSRY